MRLLPPCRLMHTFNVTLNPKRHLREGASTARNLLSPNDRARIIIIKSNSQFRYSGRGSKVEYDSVAYQTGVAEVTSVINPKVCRLSEHKTTSNVSSAFQMLPFRSVLLKKDYRTILRCGNGKIFKTTIP